MVGLRAAWCILLVGPWLAVGGTTYITAEDEKVLVQAEDAVGEFCVKELPSGDEVSKGRDLLEGALGGENFILENVRRSGDSEEFGSRVQSHVSGGWVIGRGLPIVLAIIVVLIWLCCCWTSCPCFRNCSCCRCCARLRPDTMKHKVCVLVCLLGCWIGIAVATATMYAGTTKVVDGVDNVCCTSAKVVDGLLGGVDPPRYFVGLMPVLSTISVMESNLDDGSTMLTDINSMLDRTKTVKDSVFVATEMLSVLREMLMQDATLDPVSLSGQDLFHHCAFCQELDMPLKNAQSTLSSSVGKALEQVRQVIAERIGSAERAKLKEDVQKSTKSFVDFKNNVRDLLKIFFDPNGVPKVRENVDRGVPGIVTLFVVVGWVFVLFAMIMMCCWFFREKRASGDYARSPHRLSCCTMCIAIPVFVLPALIIGGVLDVATTVLSAVCLTMDGFDGQRFVEFQNVMGNKTTDLSTTVLLIDACIAGKHGDNPNLLELINGTASDGSSKPLREILTDVTVTPIQAAFENINKTQAAEAGTPLNENPAIVQLTDKLATTPMDAMMLPVESKFIGDATYDAMLATSDLAVALFTSGRCENLPLGDGNDILGILYFLDKFKSHTVTDFSSLTTTSCVPATILCTPGDDVCTGGDAYLTLKRKLVQDKIYKCDLWHKGDSVACDPKDMVKNAGVWENDCLTTDSAGNPRLQRLTKMCNLAEFTAYIEAYSVRIDKSMNRLNDEANTFMDDLKVNFKVIVDKYLLVPLASIVDGITCGFMPVAYEDLIDGMCYQGVAGVRTIGKGFTIIGVSMMCMAIVLYFSWRWEVDNVNAQLKERVASQ